jgi:hypothetical protein
MTLVQHVLIVLGLKQTRMREMMLVSPWAPSRLVLEMLTAHATLLWDPFPEHPFPEVLHAPLASKYRGRPNILATHSTPESGAAL